MRRTKIHDVTTKFANVTFPSIQVDANLYHIKLTSTQDSIVPVSIDLYSVYSHTTCIELTNLGHDLLRLTMAMAAVGPLTSSATGKKKSRTGERETGPRPCWFAFYLMPLWTTAQPPRPRQGSVLFVATTKWTRYPAPVEWDLHTIPWARFTLKKNTKAIVVLHAGHYQVTVLSMVPDTSVQMKLRLNGVTVKPAPSQYFPQYSVLTLHSRVRSHGPVAMYLQVLTDQTFGGEPTVAVSLLNLTSMQDGQPLSRSWSLQAIKAAIGGASAANDTFLPRPSAAITAALVDFLSDQHPKDANALRPALFLVLAILPELFDELSVGVQLHVTSGDFPVGAGLGSSAAFCVSVAAALLRSRHDVVPLDTINAHAFAAEVLLHDDPSGVDNTVSTYGGAILYQKQPQSQMKALQDLPTLRFLLTNTHVPRETKHLVAKVRALHTADPAFVDGRFEAIRTIIEAFQRQTEFQAMIRLNQTLLAQVGVSHPAIDTVVNLANPLLPTKLTGAGGGGCTITFIPDDTDEGAVAALKADLAKHGFTCVETVLGGPGVKFSLATV
ncbi:hypothetical protein DYB30_001928 [Aphanomyces astaci]|uniref:Mevalonate kinase n=1 Tax=Aphanomyces astaci TaxID=112090 RepID=A0A397DAG6_APHAT|nr:hypothetical protein DYB30_001928 [Aphanomyces astaci]RHY58985.1 hypothetical protein DYB34_001611 [Aphanomyces astaci]